MSLNSFWLTVEGTTSTNSSIIGLTTAVGPLGVLPGMAISGTNIPAEARIAEVDDASVPMTRTCRASCFSAG